MHKIKRKKGKGLISASTTSFGKIRKKKRIYSIQRGVLASSLEDAGMG